MVKVIMVKRVFKSPLLIFLILSGILIFSWFRFGHIYGGGDTGLPFYNPSRTFQITKSIWWDSLAPGIPVAQGLTSAPMVFMMSIPQILGASPVFIQALLFFVLLFLMGYGMYLLALSIFGRSKLLLALSAGVFYLFNPYMMIQIWHRFIYNSMFLVAFLPFLIMTWLLWIKKRHPMYLLLFLLVNFLAVYIFGTIAFIVAVWTLLTLLTLLESLVPWKGKKVALKLSLTFSVGLLLWLLTNSWWLIPTFSVNPVLFAQQHTTDDSLVTLMELSKQTILPYTLRLINPFYLYWHADFGSIYQSPFFQFISWLFVLVVFVGLFRGLKQKAYASWSLLALVVIFLSKGAASPFSFPYIFSFSHFFPLGVIRNPFEKLGILLPLVYAILFALGLQYLLTTSIKYIGKSKTYPLLAVFILLHMAFFWPMFAGKLFGTLDKQNFVEVPKSYAQADEWIRKDLGDTTRAEGRILHLPLPRSEDATYNWQYGYHGVEPSAAIFTSLPSIARGFNLHRIDDTLTGLSLMFEKLYSQNSDKILQLLQAFNVRFIILHKDMVWQGRDVYDPQKTEEILDQLSFLNKRTQFGDLSIYELPLKYYQPKIVITNKVQFVSPQNATIRMWPWLARLNGGEMLTDVNDKDIDIILRSSNEIMVFPQDSFNYLEGSEKGLDIIGSNLVSLLYQLSNTKNTLKQNGDKDNEKLVTQLLSAGEDLINSYIYLKSGNPQPVIPLVDRYSKTVTILIDQDIRSSKLRFYVGESTFNDFFKLQLLLLENLKINELLATADKIRQDLNTRGLLPTYPYISRGDFMVQERQINHFKIPKDGKYELLLTNSQVRGIYPANLDNLDFQIDDKLLNLKGQNRGDLLFFGELELKEGIHEISFDNLISTNLIPSLENITRSDNVSLLDKDTVQFSSDGQKASYIEADLGPVSGEDSYQIMFDGSFLSGVEFYVQIIQDGDSIENGKPKPRIGTFIYRTQNNTNFQSFGFKLPSLNVATRQAKIRIIVDPTGTTSFNTPSSYGTLTLVQIKNLKVFRVLNNEIFLRSGVKQESPATQSGQITQMEQKNPVLYQGNLKIDKPSFVIFKESYHPDWELTLSDGSKVYQPSKHFLSNLYGNAWYIDKPGDYSFKIKFAPQNFVFLGMTIIASSWVGLLILLLIGKVFKFNQKI